MLRRRYFSIVFFILVVLAMGSGAIGRIFGLPIFIAVLIAVISRIKRKREEQNFGREEASRGEAFYESKSSCGDGAFSRDEKYYGTDRTDKKENHMGGKYWHSSYITCEYCGSRIDTDRHACCDHCGGPYWDNKEWLELQKKRRE